MYFLTVLKDIFGHRKHEPVEKIIEEAKKGNAFFVNRSALNGDLAELPENEQRRIVAQANEGAAEYAEESIIPLTVESQINRIEFIQKHQDRAAKIFFKEKGKSLKQQLKEFLNID